ncbi:hypothetical protein MPTK2_7g02140 [Marchantia polymorpha subsp. ruderalis]
MQSISRHSRSLLQNKGYLKHGFIWVDLCLKSWTGLLQTHVEYSPLQVRADACNHLSHVAIECG